MSKLSDVKKEAWQLPEGDRRELALELLGPPVTEDPSAVEEVWEEELQRRIEAIRSGRVQGVPGEEALARARARLRDLRD